ncbi:MAG: hypothetical protein QOG97_716 [Acidimicrobiaceae bacterium]|nr:hypothetical protein [Acidimicrobiaceae bacterium]
MSRPRLLHRLDEGAGRRLVSVVAGPGFGKSTLLADWTAGRACVWYPADGRDASLPVLVWGLVKTVGRFVPGLADDLAPLTGPRGPESNEPGVAEAIAADLSEAFRRRLDHDLFLVIDDAHEIGWDTGPAQLLAGLSRNAPSTLHLVLSSRREPPFPIERLRGRGDVLELTSTDLAFDRAEVGGLLVAYLGEEAETWADVVHEMTGGWPAATRLTLESLRSTPPAQRASAVEALRQPGGALFSYLAGEVFLNEAPPVQELIRLVAPLDRFSAGLCDALGAAGAAGAAETLGELCRRSMFVRPTGQPGWFTLHALVRDFARERWPLDSADARRLHQRAAEWLAGAGYPGEALRSLMAAGEPAALAAFLTESGSPLLASGSVDSVIAAVATLPPDLDNPQLARLEGEARQIRGDWDGALACYERSGGGQASLLPALAWRMGRIHYLRGDHEQALSVFRRAAADGREEREEAQLFAWQATAHWMRGEAEECRDLAARSFELATRAGDHQALAAAHTALALLAAMEGDLRADLENYLKALRHAEEAGDLLQIIRIRCNLGNRHNREANYHAAIAELDEVVRLSDLSGFAVFRAIGLSNRGEARMRLGQLEEAIADSTAAAEGWRRIGSSRECWALGDQGDIYRERGDLTMARAAYEHALALADRTGEVQVLVVALAGLARTLAKEDPQEAERLAQRAVSMGPGIRHTIALLAAGWVSLSRGDREQASARAVEAAATARDRRERAALAEAVELGVLAAADPAAEAGRLEEAVSIWREIGNPLGEARARLVAGSLGNTAGARGLARRAQRQLHMLGVRTQADQAAGPLASLTTHRVATLTIRTLGRFEVILDGVPVGPSAWQSRKARDLLKVLVSMHGRPVTREVLMDTLWPDEDAVKLSNRLSVALATARGVLDPERRHPANHYLAADAASVRLDLSHLQVDVESFLADAAAGLRLLKEGSTEEAVEVLVEADAAYAGEFLEEDPYEDWAVYRREEARATYIGVVRTLAHHATDVGDHDSAVRYYLRLLERDPFDEDGHLALVATLESAGRHGEARRRYRAYVARMEELAVEPAPFPGPFPGALASPASALSEP